MPTYEVQVLDRTYVIDAPTRSDARQIACDRLTAEAEESAEISKLKKFDVRFNCSGETVVVAGTSGNDARKNAKAYIESKREDAMRASDLSPDGYDLLNAMTTSVTVEGESDAPDYDIDTEGNLQ